MIRHTRRHVSGLTGLKVHPPSTGGTTSCWMFGKAPLHPCPRPGPSTSGPRRYDEESTKAPELTPWRGSWNGVVRWTIEVDPVGASSSMFSTETRVATTDPVSRERFRRYWALLSPGILAIRYETLRLTKAEPNGATRARPGVPSVHRSNRTPDDDPKGWRALLRSDLRGRRGPRPVRELWMVPRIRRTAGFLLEAPRSPYRSWANHARTAHLGREGVA
jgi:hypothetical protein